MHGAATALLAVTIIHKTNCRCPLPVLQGRRSQLQPCIWCWRSAMRCSSRPENVRPDPERVFLKTSNNDHLADFDGPVFSAGFAHTNLGGQSVFTFALTNLAEYAKYTLL